MATLYFSPQKKEETFDLLSSMFYQLDFVTHGKTDFELLKRNLMKSDIVVWKHV